MDITHKSTANDSMHCSSKIEKKGLMQQYFKKKDSKNLLPPCAPQKKLANSSIDISSQQSR
jgi:hypothetical protein